MHRYYISSTRHSENVAETIYAKGGYKNVSGTISILDPPPILRLCEIVFTGTHGQRINGPHL